DGLGGSFFERNGGPGALRVRLAADHLAGLDELLEAAQVVLDLLRRVVAERFREQRADLAGRRLVGELGVDLGPLVARGSDEPQVRDAVVVLGPRRVALPAAEAAVGLEGPPGGYDLLAGFPYRHRCFHLHGATSCGFAYYLGFAPSLRLGVADRGIGVEPGDGHDVGDRQGEPGGALALALPGPAEQRQVDQVAADPAPEGERRPRTRGHDRGEGAD